MTIKPKPTIKKFAEAGDKPLKEVKEVTISLRIPVWMNEKIRTVKDKKCKVTMTRWLIDAIEEKIARDINEPYTGI